MSKVLKIIGVIALVAFVLYGGVYWPIYTALWRPCNDLTSFAKVPKRCIKELSR